MTGKDRPDDKCPHCGADLVGDQIDPDVADQYAGEWYNGKKYFSRRIGLYDMGLDRTVKWKCPDCGGEWDR